MADKSRIVVELDAIIEMLDCRDAINRVCTGDAKSCVCTVMKAKKKDRQFDALVKDCYEIIINTRNQHTKALMKEVLKGIYNEETGADEVFKLFHKHMGENLSKELVNPLYDWTESVYRLGLSETPKTGVKLGYNVTDQKAVEIMNNHNIFFIGEYYNHNNGDIMKNEIGNLFAEALSRRETAGRVARLVELDKELGIRYFEGFVEHATSRIRNIGNIAGYEKARIEYAEVFAILDDRTTEICQEMNGRMIPVSYMSEIKDRLLSIETEGREVMEVKEDLKSILPFWSDKDTDLIKGLSTDKILSNNPGLALPPYHWRCRTETIAHFEEELIEYETQPNISSDTKSYLKNLSNQELTKKINAIVNRKDYFYNAKDLASDYKHKKHFGVKTDKEFMDIGKNIIKNAKYQGFRVFEARNGKKDLQVSFFTNNGYVVVDSRCNIRGIFPHKNIEKYLDNVSEYCILTKGGRK
jgi:hypothetical protein